MRVKHLRIEGFMSHASTAVDLPETGIVLVTGENGAGKSALLEAVSFAGWGETLRRTSPWADERGGTIELSTYDDLRVARRIGRRALVFQTAQGTVQFETTTKAQQALTEIVGEHEVWRRACVFSSQDAAHFSLATDGERKRLLEGVLGLDVFDAASNRCRGVLRAAAREHEASAQRITLLNERMKGNEKRLADASERLAHVESVEADAALVATVSRAEVDAAREQLEAATASHAHQTQQLATCRAELKSIAVRRAQLAKNECDSCGQDIGAAHRVLSGAIVDRQQEHAEKRQAALTASLVTLRDEVAARQAAVSTLRDASAEAAARERARTARAAELRQLEAARETLRAEVAKNADELERLLEEDAQGARAVLSLEAADRTLGLSGVRAMVLDDTLRAIEQIAGTWLARMADGRLQLRLSSYSARADGSLRDAISLEVDGAGGGRGYRGASGGERRRIDIALMLALDEVATAVRGAHPGTLFMDEVLDALDVEHGVPAACAVVEELAQRRCVVVISHNYDLVRSLWRSARARFRVSAGVVIAR